MLATIIILLTAPISAMNRALLGEILHPLPVTDFLSRPEDSSQQPAVKPTVPAKVVATPIDPFSDPKNPLSKRSVYFDFEQDVIKNEFKPLVHAHAKYLGEHRTASVAIEGNCDERGSREYNLALGHRRADAVRRTIMLLGVSDQQYRIK